MDIRPAPKPRSLRLRVSLRVVMGLVAVVAICLGLVERRKRLLNLAQYHGSEMMSSRIQFHPPLRYTRPGGGLPGPDDTVDNPMWHATMVANYRRAARYPFLPVPATPTPGFFILADCVDCRMRYLGETAAVAEQTCLCFPPPLSAVDAHSGRVSPRGQPADGPRLIPTGP